MADDVVRVFLPAVAASNRKKKYRLFSMTFQIRSNPAKEK